MGYGYTTKFMAESLVAHPDITPSTISMTVLSTGTDDIVSDSITNIFSTSTLSSPISPVPSYVQTTVSIKNNYFKWAIQIEF